MSRTGDCWGNSVAESYFARLRVELVGHERYPTREAPLRSVGDYIDRSTTSNGAESQLGYVNPVGFELRTILEEQVA